MEIIIKIISIFSENEKVYSLSTQFTPILSWTHYRTLLQELNKDARKWYEKDALYAYTGTVTNFLSFNITLSLFLRL